MKELKKNWIEIKDVSISDIIKAANQMANVARIGEVYKNSTDYKVRRRALKMYYNLHKEDIENNARINTLKFPFDAHFSPIEYRIFNLSYMYGNMNLFPEYPVGRFYLDFAIPRYKINIECDGKAYHDDLMDKFRDAELYKMGWKIFRIGGSAIMKSIKDVNNGQTIYDKWCEMQYWERGENGNDFKYYEFGELDRLKFSSGDALILYIKKAYLEGYLDYLDSDTEEAEFEIMQKGNNNG